MHGKHKSVVESLSGFMPPSHDMLLQKEACLKAMIKRTRIAGGVASLMIVGGLLYLWDSIDQKSKELGEKISYLEQTTDSRIYLNEQTIKVHGQRIVALADEEKNRHYGHKKNFRLTY